MEFWRIIGWLCVWLHGCLAFFALVSIPAATSMLDAALWGVMVLANFWLGWRMAEELR